VTLRLDLRERAELCDLFADLGPDAPTLCEGWTTRDLAAHLAAREREPWASAGLTIERFAGYTERRRQAWVAKDYDEVLADLRSGPPLIPWGLPGVATVVNLGEWMTHHEDVRRANGLARRTDRPDLEDAVWKLLRRGGRFLTRRIKGAGVDLIRSNGERIAGRASEHRAELRGEPVDLMLYLEGRKGAAQVELTGSDAAIVAVEGSSLGI
jgi:uncharacterized protein (TIGR03085 family)